MKRSAGCWFKTSLAFDMEFTLQMAEWVDTYLIPSQWRNQPHFTGEATRGQALFKGGQQFNDVII